MPKGRPDWSTVPYALADPIVSLSNQVLPAAVSDFGPFDVSLHSSLILIFDPVGSALTAKIEVFFFHDPAALVPATQYIMFSYGGAIVLDSIPVIAPYVSLRVTTASVGFAGHPVRFFVYPHASYSPTLLAAKARVGIIVENTGIGAGGNAVFDGDQWGPGPGIAHISTTATNWLVRLHGVDDTGSAHMVYAEANQSTAPGPVNIPVNIGGYQPQFYAENHDAATRLFLVNLQMQV